MCATAKFQDPAPKRRATRVHANPGKNFCDYAAFETLKTLARYFDVTTDYLLGYTKGNSISDLECELLRIFRTLPIENQRICIEQCRAFLKHNRNRVGNDD